MTMKGIKDKGIWLEDPGDIKKCFHDYFANKFKKFAGTVFTVNEADYKKIKCVSSDQN